MTGHGSRVVIGSQLLLIVVLIIALCDVAT